MLTRQREFFQWIIGGISTAGIVVGAVWVSNNRTQLIAELENSGSTTSASVGYSVVASGAHSTKLEVLNQHDEAKGPENKGAGHMAVSLTSPDGRRSDGSLVLIAKIAAAVDLEGLKYEWVLPDGVTLASGSLNGDIGTLAEGAANSQAITVNVSSQKSSIIHFHAYRLSAGEKVGQVAQYNSLEQSSINLSLAFTRQSIESESARKPASAPTDNRRME